MRWLPARLGALTLRDAFRGTPRGEVWAYLSDTPGELGELVAHRKNLWVNVGFARTAAWLASNTPNGGTAISPPGAIAIGTGSTAPAAGDTALGFETNRAAVTSASLISTYVVRLVAVWNGLQANYNLREAGVFDANADNGTSSGANATTTLNDTSKTWTANQWAGYTVDIVAGTGSGQTRTIASNTATALTVSATWTTTPDATSVYALAGGLMFCRAAITVNKQAGQILNVIWQITVPNN